MYRTHRPEFTRYAAEETHHCAMQAHRIAIGRYRVWYRDHRPEGIRCAWGIHVGMELLV